MKVVVIHPINGTTATAEFVGPKVSVQPVGSSIAVTIVADDGVTPTGSALFNDGMVALRGDAIDQYQPLTKPEQTET